MLDVMRQHGADADLVKTLQNAIGDRDGIEIQWSRM
jgi:hypothetical protein